MSAEQSSKHFDVEYDKSNAITERVCEKPATLNIQTAEECAKRGYAYHKLHSGKNYLDWRSCTSVFMLTKRLRKRNESKKIGAIGTTPNLDFEAVNVNIKMHNYFNIKMYKIY